MALKIDFVRAYPWPMDMDRPNMILLLNTSGDIVG